MSFIEESATLTDVSEEDAYSSPTIATATPSLITCSICAGDIPNCTPEYYCGEVINQACNWCKADANLEDYDMTPDPFGSFLESEMPASIVSHCSPVNFSHNPKQSLINIPSLRAHYVLVPNHGGIFTSIDEVLMKMKRLMTRMDEAQNYCNQS